MTAQENGRARRGSAGGEKKRRTARKQADHPLRTCLGCQEEFHPELLVRLIAEEDGSVFVDVRKQAGGRGAYVCCKRSCLENAYRKRRIPRALDQSGLTVELESLYSQLNEHLKSRLAHFLSLCQKAGQVASGGDSVESTLSRGRVRLLVLAADSAEGSVKRLRGRAAAAQVPVYVLPFDRNEFGQLLGKDHRVGGALSEGPLARAVEVELLKLRDLNEVTVSQVPPRRRGPSGAPPGSDA